jgi:signal transduction histidine kinase
MVRAWEAFVQQVRSSTALPLTMRGGSRGIPAPVQHQPTRVGDAPGSDRIRDEFLAVLSHELRSPLATIKGFVDLLISDDNSNLTVEQREFLTIVAYNAQRQVDSVEQLLTFADIRTGRAAVSLAAVHLPVLLERCVETLRATSNSQGQEVTLYCDPAVPAVLADGDRVLQILTILLDFATERVMGGGAIDITVVVQQPWVCVEVHDTGPEMAAHECERFLAGFHHATGDGYIDGDRLGLNLAIARGLAELQGGDVELRCAAGTGTTLRLMLPINLSDGANT